MKFIVVHPVYGDVAQFVGDATLDVMEESLVIHDHKGGKVTYNYEHVVKWEETALDEDVAEYLGDFLGD